MRNAGWVMRDVLICFCVTRDMGYVMRVMCVVGVMRVMRDT